MINHGLFSSVTDDWATPLELFDALNEEFNFTLDPCATEENAKCPTFFTKDQDGLNQSWVGHRVFCNPPYGKEISKWVKKAYESALQGAEVVMLIPSRTDTSYFHRYILPFCGNTGTDTADVIWSAGIIDGEGCVFVKKDKPSEKTKHKSVLHNLGLKVSMTHKQTIEKLHHIWKRGHLTIPHCPEGKKQPYIWTAISNDAAIILKNIYPYSVTKKQEIFKAIEFSLMKGGRKGHKRTNPQLIEKREGFYQELRRLKNPEVKIPYVETEIRFIRGRLKFGGCKNSAPFPSAIVIFKPEIERLP